MNALRRTGRGGLLVAVAWAAAGCGGLAEFAAPVAPPPHSALELEQVVREAGNRLRPFADDVVLVSFTGDSIRGRDAATGYLTAPSGSAVHGIELRPDRFYRCGPRTGVETGIYRAQRVHDGRAQLIAGRWHAGWVRTGDGDWRVDRADLLAPGRAAPEPAVECVEAEDEIRARARLTAGLHGAPFGFFISEPHAEVGPLGRYPHIGASVERPGWIASLSYQVRPGLSLGGYWSVEPRVRSTYRYSETSIEWLRSSAHFFAVTAGYQGRNLSVDVGPALLRSRWEWSDREPLPPDESADYSTLGAVVSARAVVPLRADVALEVMAQQRFFRDEWVPRSEPPIHGSHRGLFVGMGLALRRSR